MTHTMKILFWKVGGHPEINFVWSEGTQNHDFWVPVPPKVPQNRPKTRVRGPSPHPPEPVPEGGRKGLPEPVLALLRPQFLMKF